MSGERKVFSEKEATDIVVQAVRLQEMSEHGSTYTPGISYDDLRRMAEDVGVDERYLLAAMKGTPEIRDDRKTFLGIPLSSEFERVIDGELPPENFDVVTEALWKNSWSARGRQGLQQMHPTQVGRTMQGQISSGCAWGPIRVTSRNGRTRVWAKNGAFVPFMGGLYPTLIISFILTMATFASDGDRIPTMIGLPLVLGLLSIGSIAFVAMSKAGEKRMQNIVDGVAAAIEEENEQLRSNLEGSVSETLTDSSVVIDQGQ